MCRPATSKCLVTWKRLKRKCDAIAVVCTVRFFKEGGTVLIKPTTKHVHRQSDAETMSQTTVPLSVCWALLRSAREALKSGERTFLPGPHPGKGRAVRKMLITPSHHKWTQHQSTIVCTSGICQLFPNKLKHN